MTTLFEDLMAGLGEVDGFLIGEKTGYKVSLPPEIVRNKLRTNPPSMQLNYPNLLK